MKSYRVTITPDALDMLNQRLAYLLFVKKSEQAYDAVETDYYDTLIFHETEDYLNKLN